MRVNELSKDLQVSNTDILVALKAQGIEKKHSSNLTEEEETDLRHVFINSVHASLSFDDIKNNIPKVVDYLDNNFFTNSTITMMGDDYIKNSIANKLSQFVLLTEGIVNLNTSSDALSKAMLRASLGEEDITFILNTALKISDVSVSILSTDEKKEKEKETPENVDKMIKAKMETMGSLESLIDIIHSNLGTSRVALEASESSIMQAFGSGLDADMAVRDIISIEKPLEFNLDYLDLTKINNNQIFEFLSSLMAVDSNSTLSVKFPVDALVDSIKTFYTVDLPAIGDAAVAFARQSAKNSIKFTAERDPFETLFSTL